MTTITIQQFIDKYGDKDSIRWNYNHLDRYPNRVAALQFLTARANASHCSSMSIICLDQYEDSGFTNKSLRLKSDEWYRSCQDWHKVADSFRDVMNGVEDGTHPSPIISGGEVVEVAPYKPAIMEDDLPF